MTCPLELECDACEAAARVEWTIGCVKNKTRKRSAFLLPCLDQFEGEGKVCPPPAISTTRGREYEEKRVKNDD